MATVQEGLARFTGSVIGQQLLATRPALHDSLSVNRQLDWGVWDTLWSAKPKVDTAIGLCDRTLDADRLAKVLRRERRAAVLSYVVRSNRLSVEQSEALLATGKVTPAVADTWAQMGVATIELGWQVASRAGAESQLGFARRHPEVPDAWVLETVRTQVCGSATLASLCDLRPGLIDEFLQMRRTDLVAAVAACRHTFGDARWKTITDVALEGLSRLPLSMQVYVAMLGNPNAPLSHIQRLESALANRPGGLRASVPLPRARLNRGLEVTVPWEQVTDGVLLDFIVDLANSHGTRREVVRALPQLSSAQRDRVKQFRMAPRAEDRRPYDDAHLLTLDMRRSRFSLDLASQKALVALVERELDEAGVPAWEAFLTLLDGDFEGSLAELLMVARSL